MLYSRIREIIIIYFLFYVDPQKFAAPGLTHDRAAIIVISSISYYYTYMGKLLRSNNSTLVLIFIIIFNVGTIVHNAYWKHLWDGISRNNSDLKILIKYY